VVFMSYLLQWYNKSVRSIVHSFEGAQKFQS